MADIELVIKIPEETYNDIQSRDWKNGERWYSEEWKAIHNGTPLPKGHGDLVDRDDLLADSYCIDDWSCTEINIVDVMTVKMADAIIEADKGSEI